MEQAVWSFLALVLKKEWDRWLHTAGYAFDWAHMKQDLKALRETAIEEEGNWLAMLS